MKKAWLLLFVVTLIGCDHGRTGWPEEPKAFLGITLGAPLSASVPLCQDKRGKWITDRVCADHYDETSLLSNTPDMLGQVLVYQKSGFVDSIYAPFNFAEETTVESDMIERYGKPNSTWDYKESHTDSWDGKVICMRLYRLGSTKGGYINVALNNSTVPDPPHKNPF